MGYPRPCIVYIINLVELILSIIIAGLISDTICFKCFYHLHRDQFINGCVFGFLIVNVLVLLHVILTCDFCKLWHLIIALLGAILFFVTGILILDVVGDFPKNCQSSIYVRTIVAGLLCLLLCAVYVINVIFLLRRDDCCEEYDC